MKYHSAIKGFKQEELEDLKKFETEEVRAWKWDVSLGYLPRMFDECNVIYSEPPWPAGFQEFNKRAEKRVSYTYKDLMGAYRKIAEEHKAPVIYTAGKSMLKYFPGFNVFPIMFSIHKTEAFLVSTNPYLGAILDIECIETTNEFMENIAKNNKVLGDISCGYGNLLHYARKYNRKSILSDYNGKCIAYIRKLYSELYN